MSTSLPNLIIIGAQKCGTTSLHRYLDLHPEVSMSRLKETNFFLERGNWSRGIGWYTSQFDRSAAVRGEASPDYTDLPRSAGVAERMQSVIPGARLIYMVRNPLERIASHYVQMRMAGLEARTFPEAALDPAGPYLTRSRYAAQLEPFLEAFPREQVMVETSERFLDDRDRTMSDVFRFVGVDDSFRSPEFARLWERTEGKGRGYSLAFRLAVRRGGRPLLPRRLTWPVQRMLRLRSGGARKELVVHDGELWERIWEAVRDDVERLRELTGLELTGWGPHSAAAGGTQTS